MSSMIVLPGDGGHCYQVSLAVPCWWPHSADGRWQERVAQLTEGQPLPLQFWGLTLSFWKPFLGKKNTHGMRRDSFDVPLVALSILSSLASTQAAACAGSLWWIGGRVQRLRRLNKPLLSLGWKCNLCKRRGYGRLSKICSRYGNLMHLVETNCRSSVFIGIVQTCSVMNWSGKTLTKIKK